MKGGEGDMGGEGLWYAVQVRSRHEKIVDRILRDKGHDSFLPLYRARKRWSDRIVEVDLPLFQCYVFCSFDAGQRLGILTTPGVLRVVGFGGRPVPVHACEIEAVRAIVNSRLRYEPAPFMRIGQRVRIEDGCLRGIEGDLIGIRGKYRLIVSVSLLQRSCAVEIDSAWVTPVLTRPDAHMPSRVPAHGCSRAVQVTRR